MRALSDRISKHLFIREIYAGYVLCHFFFDHLVSEKIKLFTLQLLSFVLVVKVMKIRNCVYCDCRSCCSRVT